MKASLKLAIPVPGQFRYFLTAGLWDEIPCDSEAANLSSLLKAVLQNRFELSCCRAPLSFPSGCEKRGATPPLALSEKMDLVLASKCQSLPEISSSSAWGVSLLSYSCPLG